MSKQMKLEEMSMSTLVSMVNTLGGNVTAKTFSQRSKAVDRLKKLAAEQGVKLEEKFDAEGNLRPEPPKEERKPKDEPAAKDKKDKKDKKPKGPSIRAVAENLLLEVIGKDSDGRKLGHTYEAILAKIKELYPEAKTSIACLRWYAVHMREKGTMPPHRPRATPAKAAEATEPAAEQATETAEA